MYCIVSSFVGNLQLKEQIITALTITCYPSLLLLLWYARKYLSPSTVWASLNLSNANPCSCPCLVLGGSVLVLFLGVSPCPLEVQSLSIFLGSVLVHVLFLWVGPCLVLGGLVLVLFLGGSVLGNIRDFFCLELVLSTLEIVFWRSMEWVFVERLCRMQFSFCKMRDKQWRWRSLDQRTKEVRASYFLCSSVFFFSVDFSLY